MKHPAPRVIVIHYLNLLTRVLSRKLKKHPKNWIFKFFSLITFFFVMKWLFYRPRRERQRQAERQRKIFLLLLLFLCILTWNFDPTLKISIFEKLSNLITFFLSKCETFVRTFNLDKAYRHTIPFAWHIFR